MRLIPIAVIAAALLSSSAEAKDFTVKMMIDGGKYRFEPKELAIQPGDQVTWVNEQGGTHGVMAARVPKDTPPFESPMLEKKGDTWSHVFSAEGAYTYHCHPHAAMGMEGVILVGDAAKSVPVEPTPGHEEHKSDKETESK